MRNPIASIGSRILLISLGMALACPSLGAMDWLTMPSTYTHDPSHGVRVQQFAPTPEPASNEVSSFRTSGYTHTRSSLNYGASADNYHRVESWGDPVRPYGEWRFPYRPFSTPYPNWGAPLAGLNLGIVGRGFGGQGFGGQGFGRQGFGAGPGLGQHPGFGPGQNPAQNPGLGQGPRRPFNDRGYGNRGFRNQGFRPDLRSNPSGGLNPYPIGPGSAYPDAPYFDGYHPTYRD